MKNKVYLSCPNVALPGSKTEEELLGAVLRAEKVCSESFIDIQEMKKNRKFRRYDNFSVISEIGIEKYLPEIDTEGDNRDIATVFSTSYGPIMTNMDFISSIHNVDKVPSPTEFSHTVNNAALGHICKDLSLKGPSTLLLSSNSIGVAERLINSGKAEKSLVICADQYCEDMYKRFRDRGIEVNEMVSGFVLTREKNDNTVCCIEAGYEGNLAGNPMLEDSSFSTERIRGITERFADKKEFDVSKIRYVFVNTPDKEMFEVQKDAYKKLNEKAEMINLYDSVGSAIGADLAVQTAAAAFAVKYGAVEADELICVNSLDISGNYMIYVIGNAQ